MSRSKGDGPGYRHFKRCPEPDCDYCVNGKSKKPARRLYRRAKRADIAYQLASYEPAPCPYFIECCTCQD